MIDMKRMQMMTIHVTQGDKTFRLTTPIPCIADVDDIPKTFIRVESLSQPLKVDKDQGWSWEKVTYGQEE